MLCMHKNKNLLKRCDKIYVRFQTFICAFILFGFAHCVPNKHEIRHGSLNFSVANVKDLRWSRQTHFYQANNKESCSYKL